MRIMRIRLPFVIALAALVSLAFADDDVDSDDLEFDSDDSSHSNLESVPTPTPTPTNTHTNTTNATISATCYNLDGSEASDHVPCGSGDVVNCCNAGDICMSNGLCFQQAERGMVLSRGSCTDHSWGARCYAPCSESRRNGTVPIVNVGFDSEEPQYCCGSVTDDGDDEELSCQYGNGPFSIPRGTAIPGVAGLSAYHSESDDDHDDEDEDDDDDDEDDEKRVSPGIAVALGVGIPIGLLVMGGVLWAIWERRRRQLRIEEEDGRSTSGLTLTNMKMPGLHHRYGPVASPVPTWSGRATPTGSQSALFHPVNSSPMNSPPSSPPQSPPREGETFQLRGERGAHEGTAGER